MSSHDSDKNVEMFVIVAILSMYGLVLLIQNNFESIAAAWQYLRIAELTIVSFIPDGTPIFGDIEIKKSLEFLKSLEPFQITPDLISKFDGHFSKYFSWIPALIMIALGINLIKRSESVKNTFDMETLLKRQAKIYTEVSPYVKDNPIKQNLEYDRDDKSPKAMTKAFALHPNEWARLSPPIGLENEAKEDPSLNKPIWDGEYREEAVPGKENVTKYVAEIDKDLAERAFIKQLGNIYQGLDSLKPHQKKLYDYFLPNLSGVLSDMIPRIEAYIRAIKAGAKPQSYMRLEAEQELYALIEDLYKNKIRKKKFNLEEFLKPRNIQTIAASKELESAGKKLCAEMTMNSHHFVNAGLMSLLHKARSGGVLPTNKILWVKGVDRALWYGLDAVGKKVSQVEGAACFSHWLSEVQFNRKMSAPMIDEAVAGLKGFLDMDSEG